MATKLKGERRLTIYLPIDDVKAIDEFRVEEALPSRSAAIAELMRRGLAARPGTNDSGAAVGAGRAGPLRRSRLRRPPWPSRRAGRISSAEKADMSDEHQEQTISAPSEY